MEKTFYEMVYEVVRLIPKGRVSSYGAIARSLGAGGSARMVGYAMNNAHSLHPPVPAHRVLNRNGLLTGKFHFTPPELMQQLLENEGHEVIDDKLQNFKALHWDPAVEI
jgi:methylated-DNA-protein-cysteine methyltransferase-like protein